MRCGPSSSPTRCFRADRRRRRRSGARRGTRGDPAHRHATPPPERTGRHRSRRCSISRSTRRRTRWRGASCCRSTVVSGRSSSSRCTMRWRMATPPSPSCGRRCDGSTGTRPRSIPRRPVRPRRCTNGSRRPCASPRAAVDVLGAIRAERDGRRAERVSLSQARRHGPHVPARLPRAGAATAWSSWSRPPTAAGATRAAGRSRRGTPDARAAPGRRRRKRRCAWPPRLTCARGSEPPLPDDEVHAGHRAAVHPVSRVERCGHDMLPARISEQTRPGGRPRREPSLLPLRAEAATYTADRRGARVVRRASIAGVPAECRREQPRHRGRSRVIRPWVRRTCRSRMGPSAATRSPSWPPRRTGRAGAAGRHGPAPGWPTARPNSFVAGSRQTGAGRVPSRGATTPRPEEASAPVGRAVAVRRRYEARTGDGGGDDVGAAQVADEAGLHAVHHVADGELGVLVHDDDRAAVAAPVAGARAERHVGRVAQAVAHADALAARRAPCRCRPPAPRRWGRCPRRRAGARRGPGPVRR